MKIIMLQKNKKLYKLSKLRLDYFEKLNKPLTINESELGVKSFPSLTKESSVTILYRKFSPSFQENDNPYPKNTIQRAEKEYLYKSF